METVSTVPEAALWREAVDRVLKGADFEERLVVRSLDGIAVGPLHAKVEEAPPLLARADDRPFRVFQRIDHPVADHAHEMARADLDGGAEGLVLSLRGAASARGFGLNVMDLDTALDGVDLGLVPMRMEPAPFGGEVATKALVDLTERRRLDPALLDLDGGLDPIGDMARCGGAPRPWPQLAAESARCVLALRDRGTGGPVLRVDGRPHHEAGATEAEELAAQLSTGVAYLRALETAGMVPEASRAALSFLLAVDADVVLSLCKLRALRYLWARIEACCGLAPAPMRLDAETSWRMMTRRDPHSNMLRSTLAGAAAILGGADSLTVLPFTSALGLPDSAARRLARNTALILRDEAHLDAVVDPVAGAGAFETLTLRLCETAWTLFQDLERSGGIVEALQSGRWQARLGATRARRHESVVRGKAPIVGTTLFPDLAEVAPSVPMRREAPAAFDAVVTAFEPLPSRRDAEPFETAEAEEVSP